MTTVPGVQLLHKPLLVFLTGGEGVGWALDESVSLTRRSLLMCADLVRESTLEACDIAYSEEPLHLTQLDDHQLAGKRIVSQLDNDAFWLLRQPFMIRARQIVGLWLAQNHADLGRLRRLGLRAELLPLAVDTSVFAPMPRSDPRVQEARRRWGVPDGRFVVGNFMRDSLGADLSRPKEQKGPDVFLAIVGGLRKAGVPVHVLIAGPRRHWLRAQLRQHGIPFSFVGESVEEDDIRVNVLDKPTLNLLYHLLDLCLVTSRWESGSRVILEAGATNCRVISPRVGLTPDVLEPECIYRSFDEAVTLIERELREPFLHATLEAQRRRVLENHTATSNAVRFGEIYANADAIPPYQPASPTQGSAAARPPSRIRMLLGKAWGRAERLSHRLGGAGSGLRVSLWHEFHAPPYGGGNQFMLALKGGLERLGVTVHANRLSADVDVHFCNSAWFDVKAFSDYSRRHPLKMVHRIDGPIALYRGTDRHLDDEIFELNRRFASISVLQSGWSYERLSEMGYRPVRPIIVHNAVDARIFNRAGRAAFDRGRKIRLIATSWSDNPRKGGATYRWMEEHLDWDRFEFSFVGRTQERFRHIQSLPAVPSSALADLLRQHDIYIAASQNDPCSNALLEALACGLPTLFLEQGGHPELVGFGGLPFGTESEIPAQLDRLVENYESFQSLIASPTIESAARAYLDVARAALEG